MKNLVLLLIIAGCTAVSTIASANSALTGETATSIDQKRWTAIFDTNHTFKHRDDQDAFTGLTGRVDYTLNKTHTLRVVQAVQKNYEIDSTIQEWAPSDMFLFHLWRMPYSLGGESYQWVNSFTLPFSQFSTDLERRTRVTSQLRINYSYGRFFFSVRPSATYFMHKFKNQQTTGEGLPAYAVGVSGILFAKIYKSLSFVAAGSYTNMIRHASQFSDKVVEDVGPESDLYTFSMSLNYDVNKHISTYASYTNGVRSLLRDGTYEMYAYEPRATQYGVGLTLSY